MSVENFEEFIKNLNDELNAVSQKYSNDEENTNCASCLEKLNIFTRYTAALINKGWHSNENVANEWIPRQSMCTDGNTKIQHDLNIVSNRLDNRIQVEEQAIDSLLKVEGMIESMLMDHCRVIEDNHHLNEEVQHCTKLVRNNFDVISQLESENKTLKEELENGTAPILSARSYVSGEESAASIDNNFKEDYRIELEKFQQKLDEKDKEIEELMVELTRLKFPTYSTISSLTPSSHSSCLVEKLKMDFLSASGKIKSKLDDLEKIATILETSLKEKQGKLLEQQARIDDLLKQLESRPKSSDTETDVKSEINANSTRDSEKILAQQMALFEEQIEYYMDEREKLMEINNDLMKRMSICQKELCT